MSQEVILIEEEVAGINNYNEVAVDHKHILRKDKSKSKIACMHIKIKHQKLCQNLQMIFPNLMKA